MSSASLMTNTKRGRPPVGVNWPDKFTFKSLLEEMKGVLCSSSLRNKIKESLTNGEIRQVDKVKNNSTGRPEIVYAKMYSSLNEAPERPQPEEKSQPEEKAQMFPAGVVGAEAAATIRSLANRECRTED